jgi:ribosomal protein L7Ae-like RNA K-turn-binding protein
MAQMNWDEEKVLSALSLARKAGKAILGSESVKEAIRLGKAKCILIAGDVSSNTKKSFVNSCEYYHIDFAFCSNKSLMGKRLGREFCAVAAITDASFLKMLNGGGVLC